MPVQYWNGLGARKTDKAVDFGLNLIWDLNLVFVFVLICILARGAHWTLQMRLVSRCNLTEIIKFPVIDLN